LQKALTYLRQIDRVSLEYRPDNCAVITNLLAEDIAGFSLALANVKLEVKADLPDVTSRESGADLLISFTFKASSWVHVKRAGDLLTMTAGFVSQMTKLRHGGLAVGRSVTLGEQI
jgi:hypothetical protein